MTKAEPGDHVLIETKTKKGKTKEIEGVLMPTEDDAHTFVKLSSGYNIGIENKNIIKIKQTEKGKDTNSEVHCISDHPDLPTISILHTGGTIASKVDYRTGGVTSRFGAEELICLFPELQKFGNIKSRLVSNMWSDDLRFGHIAKIAKAVQEEIKKNNPKGIIVGMGTDNLAVAAAGLAFVLEKISIPVILVGAQRSSDRGSSDAGMNLICATRFIAETNFTGVALCMHTKSSDTQCSILPACKTKKLHTSRRDAFQAINAKEIARVDYETGDIELISTWKNKQDPVGQKELSIKPNFEDRVGILKVHVNLQPEQIHAFETFRGLIIEGTGLGQTPLEVLDDESKVHEKIRKEFEHLAKKGVIMVMTSNCVFGKVNMNVYSRGRDLQKIGVIPGDDMLSETALVKLAWLLGNYPKEQVPEYIRKNLRGELGDRTEYEEGFVHGEDT